MEVTRADFSVPPAFVFQRELPGGTIGKGAVFKNEENNMTCVAKCICKSRIGGPDEVTAYLARLKQVNAAGGNVLVRYDTIMQTDTHLTLIRPFLADHSVSEPTKGAIDQDRVFTAWKTVAGCVKALHDRGIFGVAVRPNNVFLIEDSVVVADLLPPLSDGDLLAKSPTPFEVAFIAPELLQGARAPGGAADLWSLGVLLAFMITQSVPWPTRNVFMLTQQIATGKLQFVKPVKREIEPVIRSLLTLEPEKRQITCELVAARKPTLRVGDVMIPSGKLSSGLVSGKTQVRFGNAKEDPNNRMRMADVAMGRPLGDIAATAPLPSSGSNRSRGLTDD